MGVKSSYKYYCIESFGGEKKGGREIAVLCDNIRTELASVALENLGSEACFQRDDMGIAKVIDISCVR
jgi:hypothetical protein